MAQRNNNIHLWLSAAGSDANAVVIDGLNMTLDTRYRILFSYDSGTIRAWVDDVEGTVSVYQGSVPAAIHASTSDFTVGDKADHDSGWTGRLAHLWARNAALTHGGYIDPDAAGTLGYWDFEGNLDDASPTGRDLTAGSTISYIVVPAVAEQQIRAQFQTAQAPDLLFIDRRHNLTAGATVRLMRGDWFGGASVQEGSTAVVVAGQPVFIELDSTPTADAQWWIAIDDPDNNDEYIELPAVWLGNKSSLMRSFELNSSYSTFVPGGASEVANGSFSSHVSGDELYQRQLSFRTPAADVAILEAAIAEWNAGRQVVWSEDGTNEMARLVVSPDALPGKRLRRTPRLGGRDYQFTVREHA